MIISTEILIPEALALLKRLIATPSFSKEEKQTAELIGDYFRKKDLPFDVIGNNVYVRSKHFDPAKKTILLNSHHDTVKPNKGYTVDPFDPIDKDGKLFGLGSNDAGGCLVALIAAFLHFYPQENLPYNLLFVASAEEEISGVNGIELVLPLLGEIDFGIVGEPTKMQMAVAERGLMVLDCEAVGVAGHAARNEGDNALYKALTDIELIRNHRFEKVSDLLGETRMTVTSIETENKQHNVVPPQCRFVVDVRVNELYTFEEVLEELQPALQSSCVPRSMRLRSSSISLQHPLVKAGLELGCSYYGSPTTSDKALMPFDTLKIGPGDSARSHTADEYIYIEEIESGIKLYIDLLNKVLIQ